MKQHQSKVKTSNYSTTTNGFLPSSIKFLSSCVKTVSSGVRSAGTSVAAAISSEDCKDQVLWACFDRLELGPSVFKNVLLLGYIDGFQVLDVDDASNVTELVSKRDDPCTFMQIQPVPAKLEHSEGFRASHPLLLVVAGNETKGSDPMLRRREGLDRDGFVEPLMGNFISSPTNVRFYSMRSHNYVHVLRFRSPVYMIRCSPRIIAVGLASQIYCFDALTLESKLSVLTYPVPQLGGQGINGINVGYGPMDVGPRWLAYTPNNPLLTNTGRLSPQNLTPSPGVSPSTSPGNGSLMARYAMESSKQLANGIINLGDKGYKTFSKYCQEFLPDTPGSPISSNHGWKVGRGAAHSSETDNAGMVVVKDFVSGAIVSQLKAHSSPISALCFDPSGTLLVTASIHGNNINIFRIMPSCSQSGSGSHGCNSTSYVHLYRLHRGITSAVIQDICFSHYSQWVAIVSSKGTCHIFVLSPFGGECGLQAKNPHGDGRVLAPLLSPPWWVPSSFNTSRHSFPAPPPAPVTASVVSRIRTGNSGWLNTVSTAASSAAGIASMTLSSVSAVFHCSLSSGIERYGSKMNALEHLLVYSPSGHLIQYELLPSIGAELNETSRSGSAAGIHIQDEDLRVKSEIVQWWDVCRRADWPEREEHVTGMTLGQNNLSGMSVDVPDTEENDTARKGQSKSHEQSHWYISNAEVQVSCGRIPLWQRSKMYFYTMSLMGPDELKLSDDTFGGEIDIETFPDHEVELRRKDLLPVFNHSQSIQSDWGDRVHGALRSSSARESHLAEDKYAEGAMVFPNKLAFSKAMKKSENGLYPSTDKLLGSSEVDMIKQHPPGFHVLAEKSVKRSSSISVSMHGSLKHYPAPTSVDSCAMNQYPASVDNCAMSQSPASVDNGAMNQSPASDKSCIVNSPSSLSHMVGAAECSIPKERSSNSVGTSDASNVSSNRSDFSMNLDEGSAQEESFPDQMDFGQFFQEGYCKASPDECGDMGEVVTDMDCNSSPNSKEKSEEDVESDEMLGGVFAFAEEG